jgi:hypothetical protein
MEGVLRAPSGGKERGASCVVGREGTGMGGEGVGWISPERREERSFGREGEGLRPGEGRGGVG